MARERERETRFSKASTRNVTMEIKKNLLVSSFNEVLQEDKCQTLIYLLLGIFIISFENSYGKRQVEKYSDE